MARIIYAPRAPRVPPAMPGYGAHGFARFIDRLMIHGLEHLGLFYSTYRATVVSNEDPENEGNPDPQGRLQIRVPGIGDTDQVTRIAYPVFPFAGPQFGFKCLPEAGDQVWVEFENGRADIPIWKGGWFARDEIPSDFSGAKQHAWFTRGGHSILLDETDNSANVRVRHLNGAEVLIDKDGNIKITNVSGKLVTVGAGDNEDGVLGNTLLDLIGQLIDAINMITVPTGTGPSGVPINAASFIALKQQLRTFLSRTVKVAK